jgi:carbonic anhydrase
MSDHYTVELRKGDMGDMETLRSHEVHTVDDALNLIDGLRNSALQRDHVTWQADEVDVHGNLYGLSHGTVYQISCVPPLTEALAV